MGVDRHLRIGVTDYAEPAGDVVLVERMPISATVPSW
jgi:hypothetical protein